MLQPKYAGFQRHVYLVGNAQLFPVRESMVHYDVTPRTQRRRENTGEKSPFSHLHTNEKTADGCFVSNERPSRSRPIQNYV